ncbi:MAG: tRNA (5-methylaminomethyl-2-thiouridine)(34)-methyltransferase MnmD [Gammaproteobacteria bacterium]|nr:tRNA (5-methylaminomethyl-2-thiouridine)(34)-methyltransferase MnmD [Gammaproteobacteria bacterium]MYE50021.1 tRNA (5-methylaminomethyl-2-thiouridine)(34)-methyltransferase MnmD [Gammaproteobacteria bacterium]
MIEPADLTWRDGQPFARDFNDIYHAPDGAREVQRVFMAPAQIERKAAEAAAEGLTLRIGELGFGTGLNFAVAVAAALKAGCRLHFISFDSRPIAPDAFAEIARQRRTVWPIYADLQRAYPPLLAGWHRRAFAEGRITLSLYWGEAGDGLADLATRQRQPIDAWFLDGFAPNRNPAMWRGGLLAQMASLSTAGTSIATFSAAGAVRRRLLACGFNMRRVDQRPHKRESLAGAFAKPGLVRQPVAKRVAVAGAGIAGASIARHLAEQGVAVDVFDPAESIASGASGIPAALLHPRLLGDGTSSAAWRAHAYAYSHALMRRFPGFLESGVLQVQGPNLSAEKMRRIALAYSGTGLVEALNSAQATPVSGWSIGGDALRFPHSGLVEPKTLTRALLDHPLINLQLRRSVPLGTRPLALACAGAVRRCAGASFLELVEVGGQMDIVAVDERPHLPVVGDGYLAPIASGVAAGATFEHRPWPVEEATAHNLRQLEGRRHRWIGRVRASRAIASDRTPIVGELAEGLTVSTAHGAMGMTTAPFAGAIVASRLTGDFPPLERSVEALVEPARFRRRLARRGYRLGASA